MNVYETVVDYIQKSEDKIFLLKRLGYGFADMAKGQRSVQAFLEAGSLKVWMDGDRFDGVNGTDLLMEKLAEMAGIDRAQLKEEMRPLQTRRSLLHNLSQPYLAVEVRFTFKQTLQNMMKHEMDFDKKWIFDQSLNRTLKEVAQAIRIHDRDTGQCPILQPYDKSEKLFLPPYRREDFSVRYQWPFIEDHRHR